MVGGLLLAAAILAVVVVSLLAGPRFHYDGEWEGHRPLPAGPDPYATYTAGWVVLKIRGTRFDLTTAGVPLGGYTTSAGNGLILHIQTIMNLPLSREGSDAEANHPDISVKPQPDGTLSFDDPKAVDGKLVVLKRKQ